MMSAQSPLIALDSKNAIQRMRELLSDNGGSGWDKAWQENLTPWDHGEIQPSLAEALQLPVLNLLSNGKALVPGCGRGYDVAFIASKLNYDVLGLDLSPSAIDAANAYVEKLIPIATPGNVNFLATDFFAFKLAESDGFDLIFDHTFFCAIPPSLRSDWGRQMSNLARPGGFLITLVYPMDGPREDGPPFSVSVENYADALGHQWNMAINKIPFESSPSHKGRERLVVWQRKV
ncbi:S-adenosyl-L-methionine-dependent methyltransferase [Phellopilus nigrolimitatus]|nr:S-adenosyl-L-methionine-dependent methyltransferase [Phellopilus nigrolimitatus]